MATIQLLKSNKLQQLCKEYADGARDMQQFLRAVGHTSISNNGINVVFIVN